MPETKQKKSSTTPKVKKTSKSKKPAPVPVVAPEPSSSQELKLKKVKKVKNATPTAAPTATATVKPRTRPVRTPVDVNALFERPELTLADLDPLTVGQLKDVCRNRKVVGYSGKRKYDIIRLLARPPTREEACAA